MFHYVYKLTDTITGEFYFGSRTCYCDPKEDNYMGSMSRWKPDKSRLVKNIIKLHTTRDEALLHEAELIKQSWKEKTKLNRNYAIPGRGFGKPMFAEDNPFFGRKHTLESKRKMSDKTNHFGKNNPMFGKKHSSESKQKMALLKRGVYDGDKNPRAKKLWQFDLEGNLIKVWDCAQYCIKSYEDLNMSRGNISSAASYNSTTNKNLKKRYGYYFSFEDISEKIKKSNEA